MAHQLIDCMSMRLILGFREWLVESIE
jgi:hypothetical protein